MSALNLRGPLERLDTVTDENGEPTRNEFSSRPCECCDGLAGERYTVRAAYRNPRRPCGFSIARGTFEVCPDCVYRWQ